MHRGCSYHVKRDLTWKHRPQHKHHNKPQIRKRKAEPIKVDPDPLEDQSDLNTVRFFKSPMNIPARTRKRLRRRGLLMFARKKGRTLIWTEKAEKLKKGVRDEI